MMRSSRGMRANTPAATGPHTTVKREDAIAVLEHSKSGLLQEIHA